MTTTTDFEIITTGDEVLTASAEGRVATIDVVSQNAWGNPFEVTLTGVLGHAFDLRPDFEVSFQIITGIDEGLGLRLSECGSIRLHPVGTPAPFETAEQRDARYAAETGVTAAQVTAIRALIAAEER